MRVHKVLGPALVALSLSGLRRLRGRGAQRLRARDIPALLGREDVLVLDTETTGVGRNAEVVEAVAIDTTGALRFEALSFPFGPISRASWEVHGLSAEALQAMGARPGRGHNLADAMENEGLAWEGRHHRAEADCRAVLALMRTLARA